MDLFIMLISTALAARFEQIAKKIKSVQNLLVSFIYFT